MAEVTKQMSVRVNPDTPALMGDLAGVFGYSYRGRPNTGALIDKIALIANSSRSQKLLRQAIEIAEQSKQEPRFMFTSEKFNSQRTAVIDLFERYTKNRDTLQNDLGQQDSLSKESVDSLTTQIENLKENKYLLAVIGESKSGKSAFINGLIKKPLLPTGILQCTSGIIEIEDTYNEHSLEDKVYLKVKYANDYEEEFASEDNDITDIHERLRQLASFPQEYRSLPIWQLNHYLIENRPDQITDDIVEELISSHADNTFNYHLENPHKLSEKDFKHSVKKYLEEYQDLSKIALQITMGCPLGFKFTHLRIVDTPGVNARGGLKQATIEYIMRANAAVVIHPIKNIASEALENFISTAVPKQAQENIFMFLTHMAHSTDEEVGIIIDQAKRLFPDINPERIIPVDNILKRIYDELKTGKKPRELAQENEEIKKLIAKYILDFGDNVEIIQETILEDSNFHIVENLLRDFSEHALEKELASIVNQIAYAYEEQKNIYKIGINLRNGKLTKQPEEFELEIDKLKNLLKDYKTILVKFSRSKREEYAGINSKRATEFKMLGDEHINLLNNSCSIDEVRKHILDFNSDCDQQVIAIGNQMLTEYQNKMEEVGEIFNSEHSITPPKFTFEDIVINARERAYETVKIPGNRVRSIVIGTLSGGLSGGLTGITVGPIGVPFGAATGAIFGAYGGFLNSKPDKNEIQFNNKKFLENLIEDANHLVGEISDKMSVIIGELFTGYDKAFNKKLSMIIEERQQAYEELKNRKKEAENLKREINLFESRSQDISKEIQLIINIRKRLP